MKIIFVSILLVVFIGLLGQSVFAQQDEEITKREVVSNIFTKNRNDTKNDNSAVKKTSVKMVYKGRRIIRSKSKKIQNTSSKPSTAAVIPIIEKQLGVTMWKLRSEQKTDSGARILKMGSSSNLVAERVSLDTIFQPNDLVRLSIESSAPGYLYVIDREMNNTGDLGEAYLIFPTLRMRNGINRLGPGTVIEIPAQSDAPSYFEITPSSKHYGGEMLTFIISPVQLPNIIPGDEPLKISAKTFSDWQDKWEENADMLELKDGEKLQYTESEKKAGQGNFELNQDDLPPQTYFEIKAPQDRPIMFSFPMNATSDN